MAANLTVAVKAAAVASGERKQLAPHGETHSRSSSRPSTQSSSRSASSSVSRFGQSGSSKGGKNVPYMTVDEVLAKSKAWHAARGEAASPSGGAGNSNGTALAAGAGAEVWNGSYMRKQFPPSWFLTGDYSKVGYGMGSPVPLSYHGNHEMLSYLPEILQPRHQPLEHWSPEAAVTTNKRAANANSSTSAGRPETQPSGRDQLSRGRGVGTGGGGGRGGAGGVAGAGEDGGDTQHEVKFTNNDSRRGKQAGLPAL